MELTIRFKLVRILLKADSAGTEFTFEPEYDGQVPAHKQFSNTGPNGRFVIYSNRPAVIDSMKLGQSYYFHVQPVHIDGLESSGALVMHDPGGNCISMAPHVEPRWHDQSPEPRWPLEPEMAGGWGSRGVNRD